MQNLKIKHQKEFKGVSAILIVELIVAIVQKKIRNTVYPHRPVKEYNGKKMLNKNCFVMHSYEEESSGYLTLES